MKMKVLKQNRISENKDRELWIDAVKFVACILVVLGHFFQSIISSGIIKETFAFLWFDKTIYYFHVPLFFICSGYLYQRKSQSTSHKIVSKAMALGIPYFVFSIATWVMKELFSSSINIQNDHLIKTLFLEPSSPYWYLYTLFFVFVFMPRLKKHSDVLFIPCVSLGLKIMNIWDVVSVELFALNSVMEYSCWFVFGMLIQYYRLDKRFGSSVSKKGALLSLFLFLCSSVLVYLCDMNYRFLSFIMGMWACFSIIILMKNTTEKLWVAKVVNFSRKYTMPIFLMHTMFAAGVRTLLFKFGVTSWLIHILGGLTISFIGPIVALVVLEILNLDFIVYPNKYLLKGDIKCQKN